ncbi:bifunctional non-homologous end joining protein LigD [Terribacillus aidingensis]|uniref:Bifunctional non-homologous end joining protein LigD n=1 Tax=Terribacillus aidingensis TaxID=586416 RepID=A0A285N4F3_9BACI|nr:DNA ligase D [Terribacillus aidingensis]SNZ04354.1 bifunctional non-homologous end joining protein LigD [Terribacillus aidingensis]
MQVMKPIYRDAYPVGEEWIYEVKYDGFRAVLTVTDDHIRLTSKNGVDLAAQFPEVILYCEKQKQLVQKHIPFSIDGELIIPKNKLSGDFSLLQTRGRMKAADRIQQTASKRPAVLMAFDLLIDSGKKQEKRRLSARKQALRELIERFRVQPAAIRFVDSSLNPEALFHDVVLHQGEGMIAKRSVSTYKAGKQHHDWYKIKNWRTISAVLTAYDTENDYFHAQLSDDEGKFVPIGKCKHGLEDKERNTLTAFFKENGKTANNLLTLPPAICAKIHCLGQADDELREPRFQGLSPQTAASECTVQQANLDLAQFPKSVELSKLDKLYWEQANIEKLRYLLYIRTVAPFMLPHMVNRELTVIRCPDGVEAEFFYQKHRPDYAPDFIPETKTLQCPDLQSLIWFANHGSIEFHAPFHYIGNDYPCEIAIDLDPPTDDALPLAIKAANLLKEWLDQMELHTFIKTSGSSGLQLFIPLPENQLTYEQAGTFTEALARLLVQQHPDLFTIERMKKNRHERLYIDYVQFGKGKTLPVPYTARKRSAGTVSAPLFWEEVKDGLSLQHFTIDTVQERIRQKGCPFTSYGEVRNSQKLDSILQLV